MTRFCTYIATCIIFAACCPVAMAGTTARYSLTFDATWSQSAHPQAYPAGAHFSALIGGVHNDQAVFWAPGQLALAGIEQMAEVGGTTSLRNEVQAAIDAGTASEVIQGDGIGSPGNTSLTVQVSDQFPLITLVTMIAPSPDWFVGVHGFDPRTPSGWVNQAAIDLFGYDAGTEEGTGFSLSNPDTVPRQPIAPLVFPFAAGSPRLGTFTFTRIFAGRSIGDYDDNGVVDAADFVVWRDSKGQTGPNLPADGNLDGNIDVTDFGIWRGHFGQSASSAASIAAGSHSTSVPEPATAVILAMAIACFVFNRRSRSAD